MQAIIHHRLELASPRAIGAAMGAAVLMLSLAACGRDDRTSSAGGDVAYDTSAPLGAPVTGGPDVTGGAPATATPAQPGTMSADEAEDVIEDALRADSTLAVFRLDADDERGRVVLEGVVATEAQKARAGEIAVRVAPGVPIDNQLRVDAAAAQKRAAANAADEADDRIEDALEADSTLRAFDLDADDENGRVVLTGTVRTAAQRQLAEDVAKRVAPGIPLDNRIRVE